VVVSPHLSDERERDASGKTGAVKVLGKLGFTIQPRRPAT